MSRFWKCSKERRTTGRLRGGMVQLFKNSDIVSRAFWVNNNPLLRRACVCVKTTGTGDDADFYAASRMEKAALQSEETVTGWHYDFNDQIFNSYTMRQNRKILSLVTEIKDSDSGTLGMIEAAMTMENMFPSLYENIEDEWSCFLTEDGGCYFGEGDGEDENTGRQELLAEIWHSIRRTRKYRPAI